MEEIANVAIVGSGPAAQTAALHLSRANLNPVLFEGDTLPGGLFITTKTIKNFPGFPDGIYGYELIEKIKASSLKYGTKILTEQCISIEKEDDLFRVKGTKTSVLAQSIIICTGSTPRKLEIPNFSKYWQNGISTCAVCDGGLHCYYRNKPLAVVGGGDTACEEAFHLSHTASKVYLIHRRDELRASKIMADRIKSNKKIEIIWDTEVVDAFGKENLEGIIIKNNKTLITSNLEVYGLFIAIGHTPNSDLVKNIVNVDESGYIITDHYKKTSVDGIYAAGDVQDPYFRQAITAAGSGCMAALSVERWLNTLD